MFADHATAFFIANSNPSAGNSCRSLERLFSVQQVTIGIADFVDPEAFHLGFPYNDYHPDPLRKIQHSVVCASFLGQALGAATRL